ncbi:MAG TPA: amidohydrolase family protein [Pseudonocardia sp.]|uniref:amidohydrolase family protein n=1 Tax=Pseudonocardia sp. TaxID=60912 RepID=UPI002B4AE6FE|nr:amidohydrolase family protein [Pseudonocardia sp.]HLU57087.1 amidohydrolase family protein [Pseudonocardia sp.]
MRLRSIRGARLLDGMVADLRISGAQIASGPAPDGEPGVDLDATGWRVLPSAVEPHAHLDKALTAPRIPADTGNDLGAAIAQWRALVADIDGADIAERALVAVRRYAANGITTIRTHVDVPTTGDPARGVEALVELRERLRGRVTLQVCMLAGHQTPDSVLADVAARGVDVIGGCPHIASDPRAETSRMLDLAERLGLPVDLHADEQTGLPPSDAGLDIVDLAEQVLARGLQQRVTASHCVRLGMLPPDRLARVLDVAARAGLGIVTLPITNLYLQGRDATHAAPRGIAAVRQILDAGIPLAAGGDNLRDPFNPAGRADPFETTSLLMTAAHLRPLEALAAVTTGARTVLGLPPAGTAPGAVADLVLVPDVDLGDVLAGAVGARVVVSAGRVVADTRVARALDLPNPATPDLAPQPLTDVR